MINWQSEALCAQVDADMWFPEAGGLSEETKTAKRICQECPIQKQCLQYALDHDEQHGIWGGLSPDERKALAA